MSFAIENGLELHVGEEENGTALVELSGRLDSTTASTLDDALSSLLDKGINNIILSCASLRYVSSAGLSVFLKVFRETSKRGGGELLLCSVADNIERVLDVTGFSSFMPAYHDVNQARQHLQEAGKL